MDKLRAGFVSPLQDFSLRIIDTFVLNENLFLNNLSEIDGVRLAYTTLVQSGLERIYFLGKMNSVTPLPPLRGRVRHTRDHGYFKALDIAHRGLAKAQKDKDHKREDLVILWATLADILYALRTHQPIILFSKLPDLTSIEPALPSEIALPVRALFRSFRDISTVAPTPSLEVDRKSVEIFEEILGSRSYGSYVQCHEVLAAANVSGSRATTMIRKAGDFLVSRYRLLNLKRAFVSVLPLSARLVDTVFQIPGKLGETLGGLAQQWLSNRQRIVFYRYDHVVSDLIHHRVEQLLRTGINPQELARKFRDLKSELSD